jgi:aminoethylphosphonate catabolism LysR family transcriptional regulator
MAALPAATRTRVIGQTGASLRHPDEQDVTKDDVSRRGLQHINFNQLRSFHAVAREMSFTKAARALNIGQSTLTVQVRDLEERYSVELFVRSSRGLQLSKVGQALFEITKPIFVQLEQAVGLLRSTGDAVAGNLRVGTVGPFFVMKLLAQYQARYPLVQVSIDSDNSDGVVRKILESTTDVAITGRAVDDARLYSRKLRSHEILVFVNRHHPLAYEGTIKLRELHGQRVIMRERGSMTRAAFEQALEKHDVRPKVVMEVTRDAVREAVIEGLGIGLVSDAEFQPHEDLRACRVVDHPSYTQSYVICLEARRCSKPISLFADLAESIARSMPAGATVSG